MSYLLAVIAVIAAVLFLMLLRKDARPASTTQKPFSWTGIGRQLDYSAIGATARQVSDWPGLLAENCLDKDLGSICHTLTPDATGLWWEVDLQNAYDVKRVLVQNRRDCCAERIVGAQLQVLSSERKLLKAVTFDAQQMTYSFPIEIRDVRFVRIQLARGIINLAEVVTYVM